MREWPKKLYAESEGARWRMLSEREGPHPRSRRYPFEVEVIPAELGRDLYEAMKPLENLPLVGARLKELGSGEWAMEMGPVRKALARYEREVGK